MSVCWPFIGRLSFNCLLLTYVLKLIEFTVISAAYQLTPEIIIYMMWIDCLFVFVYVMVGDWSNEWQSWGAHEGSS